MRTDRAVADLDAGTITRTIRIEAPIATVWTALTSPEHIATWWGHPSEFPDGWRVGSLGHFLWENHRFEVRIDELDPPATFALTWGDLDTTLEGSAAATSVRFTLAGDAGSTTVTVLETGFDRLDVAARRAAMEENTGGWNTVLDALRDFSTGRVTPADLRSEG
ncbi:ATPase [Occultella glacieicola]|uniref:ATPase n=1 Tax=Occultella glacieicola TaxID=2518684 RepID=A0ABY2E641_9MICO|nr:SRPBCC domain-containing protein [Occultella glacieicola]TDE95831.1 ATPase [Occultella glacieicola]